MNFLKKLKLVIFLREIFRFINNILLIKTLNGMKNYITEFIGTFFLVTVIGMTVIEPGAGNWAPIAIGTALMVMVFAGGHRSGGHYNPAVSLAVWMRGKLASSELAPYIVSQLVGAIFAGIVVGLMKDTSIVKAATPEFSKALVAEILGTFALAYVVLNTATDKDLAGNSFYGLAIGFTVVCMAYAFGGVSGGAFNPAVAVGISQMGLSSWQNLWIFLIGNFVGAVLAAIVFRYLEGKNL
jgi:aquaporin Z